MSDSPRDLTKCTISNAPGFLGGFTIAAAAPDFLTFGLDDDGLSFKIFVTQPGVGAEIRKGCIFAWNGGVGSTLTRGTMVRSTGVANAALEFSSAALVSVVPSAEDFLITERVAAFNEMLVNVGTEAVPVWELQANLIPRTNTFAYLTNLLNGSGEICSATDVPAIVQLNGTAGSGTVSLYSPMYPGSYNEYIGGSGASTKLEPVQPWISTTSSHVFTVKAPDSINAVKGGRLSLEAGDNAATGAGGDVYLRPGTGGVDKAGGAIYLSGAPCTGTGAAGTIQLATGTVETGTPGSIVLKQGNTTMFRIGTVENTMGFYGATPVTKPTVTGSKASGAALDSLLTALSSLGLIDISGVTA